MILSGARRQENRWDPTQNEQVVPETKETQKKLFDDAMYKLEHGADDKQTASDAKPRLAKLYNRNEAMWNDDFAANQQLRNSFRVSITRPVEELFSTSKNNYIFQKRKKELKISTDIDEALLKKTNLSISLVPEREDDKKLAKLLFLKPSSDVVQTSMKKINKIIESPALKSTCISRIPAIKSNKLLDSTKVLNTNVLGIIRRSKNGRTKEEQETIAENAKQLKLVSDYGSSTSNSDTD